MRYFEGVFMPAVDDEKLAPVRTHVSDLLAVAVPEIPEALLRSRVMGASTMFLNGFVEWDRLRAQNKRALLDERSLLREQLEVATAAILAPVAEEVLSHLSVGKPRK
jgi:hypothetical protein